LPTVALTAITVDVDRIEPLPEQPPAKVATITRNAPAQAILPPRTWVVFFRRHNPASSMNSQLNAGRKSVCTLLGNLGSWPAPNIPPDGVASFPPSAAPVAPSLIVSCVLVAELSSVNEAGANAHLTPAGRPVQEN
jgi:hypothetical protein